MTTRADLRLRVRRELNDQETVQLWSDAQINDSLADAVRELGVELPRAPRSTTVTTVTDQRTYTLTVTSQRVVGVEYPLGTLLESAGGRVGVVGETPGLADDGLAQAWTADDQAPSVRLWRPPTANGETIRVWYLPHLVPPANDVDPVPVATDEEALVVLSACLALWDQRRLGDAKRGLRTQLANPFAPRVKAMFQRRRRRARGGLLLPDG